MSNNEFYCKACETTLPISDMSERSDMCVQCYTLHDRRHPWVGSDKERKAHLVFLVSQGYSDYMIASMLHTNTEHVAELKRELQIG